MGYKSPPSPPPGGGVILSIPFMGYAKKVYNYLRGIHFQFPLWDTITVDC